MAGPTLPVYVLSPPRNGTGTIGFSPAPGRRGRDREGRYWTRDLDEDIDYLHQAIEASHLVILLSPKELDSLRISSLATDARQAGMTVIESPFPPEAHKIELETIDALIKTLNPVLDLSGQVIFISGDAKGRSPLAAACLAMARGGLKSKIIEEIQNLRGQACLTEPFLQLIHQFKSPAKPQLQTAHPRAVAAMYKQAEPVPSKKAPPQVYHASESPLPISLAAPKGMMIWTPCESTCIGALLGAALGDTLGSPLSSCSQWEVLESLYGTEGPREPQITRYDDQPPLACISGHTEMIITSVETAIEARQRRWELTEILDNLSQRLAIWSKQTSPKRIPSPSGLNSCQQLASGMDRTSVGSNHESGAAGLARAIAFGLAFSETPKRVETLAAAQSRITHQARTSVACAAALAVGISALASGAQWRDCFSEMVAAACRISPATASRLARILHEAETGMSLPEMAKRSGSTSTLDTTAFAIYVTSLYSDDLESALRHAVMTPGDSHAVAATVGALIGTRLGSGALPPVWLAVLEHRSQLEGLALALAASR